VGRPADRSPLTARLDSPPRPAEVSPPFRTPREPLRDLAVRRHRTVPARPACGAPSRPAARALLLDAPDAHPRGTAGGALPPDQGGGRPLPLARAGGGRRRQRLRPRPGEGRRALPAHPEPRLDAGAGRHAARGAPAVHGQGRQPHPRPGAQHPLRGAGARLHRPDLAPGRHGAGDGRRDPQLQAPRPGPGGPGLRGRRCHQHRRVPRGDQPRRGAALPAGGHHREQRLRLLDADLGAVRRGAAGRQGRGLRHSRGCGPTATTCSRPTG
jgi:hypothetical protein